MQMGGVRQKHNAEGGREAKKFKNHCYRPIGKNHFLQNCKIKVVFLYISMC